MKLLPIKLLLCMALILCLCPSGGQTLRLRQQREASAAPEPAQDAELAAAAAAAAAAETESSESAEEFISDATTTTKPLGIVSIKSRAIAMDRALCKELSRYHPHYPKCHQYCKRLDHWIGQCWRDSCHCIS